jgi:hypothetical protein
MGRITAETHIKTSLASLWEATQTPALHQRWDLRFSTIEYLPKETPESPQRFLYTKNIGFGLVVKGFGETVTTYEAANPTQPSGSVLKFWTTDWKSLITEGKGCWVYKTTLEGIHFSTVYDYEVRYGWLGQLADWVVLRPAMSWATRFSFDCLRLWLEAGVVPELSWRLWLSKTTAKVMLALVWIYEGLIPKILFVGASELALVQKSTLYWQSPALTLAGLGIAEILFGFWLLGGQFEKQSALLSFLGLLLLPILVILTTPQALIDPFGGLSKNLGLLACAFIVWLLADSTPRGYWWLKKLALKD